MSERIAIVGAGAVGGFVGACLADSGFDVTLIDPWPAHVDAIRTRGMRLSGTSDIETRTINVEAVHLTDVQGFLRRRPFDIAFIATKSYDTDWATMLIRPYVASEGVFVSLQNCINENRIAAIVGWPRTMGCVVAGTIGVDLYEAGCIRRDYAISMDVTSFYLGEPHGRITPRAVRLAELMNHVATAVPTTNLWGERWTKLCTNSMRNGVSALTGMSGNERDLDRDVRRFCIRLGGQAVRVGQALGYMLGTVGNLDSESLALAAEGNPVALESVESIIIHEASSSFRSSTQRPSMAQDIEKGRRTEIEYMNGNIATQGEKLGLEVDSHTKLTALVKRLESGRLIASREILFARYPEM